MTVSTRRGVRRRGVLAGLAVAPWLLFPLGVAHGDDPEPPAPAVPTAPLASVRLALQWQPQSQFAGFYLARNKGLFKAAGLDVQLLHGDADHSSLAMLLEGAADAATLFLADALVAATPPAPPPFVQLAQLVRRSNLMLVAWKDLGIERAADLGGRRVSYWQGSFSTAFEAFFADNGVSPAVIPQYYSVNLFLRRGVVACAAMEYNEYHRIWQAGIDFDRLTAFRMRDYGLGFPEDGLYAATAWFERYPEAARALREAVLAGWVYARDHPEEAIDAVMAEARQGGVPANRPHEQWMLRHILESIFIPGEPPEAVGTLDPGAFARTAEALRSAGLLTRVPDLRLFAPGGAGAAP